MSSLKRRRQKDKGKLPPFAPMTWEKLKSQAYRELTPSAAKALPYFFWKAGLSGWREGRECTQEFELTYGEAESQGFASRTFSRVIKDLVDKGFIDSAGYGGLRGFCKTANRFYISERWRYYGKPNYDQKQWKRDV